MNDETEIGSAAKRREFVVRHADFFQRGTSLQVATSAAFDRRLPEDASELDKIIFYLGVRAVADFGAIMLLAANGSGLNAIALVRGLYERVTVASYLRRNPTSAKSFVDYSAVQTYRTLIRFEGAYEFDEAERRKRDDVKQWRDEVAEQFTREECPACKRRPMQNWTKVDFVTMAKSIEDLAGLLAAAYDVPLAQAHATPASMIALLKREDGKLVVRDDFSDEADRAFHLAHTLLLHALNLQVQHFSGPELESAVERAAHDYVAVWGRSSEPAA